jgi:hypothetical protein
MGFGLCPSSTGEQFHNKKNKKILGNIHEVLLKEVL